MQKPSLPDTIVAIATAPGRAAVGVVRVSGPGVPTICRGLMGRVPDPRKAVLARFRDASGAALDQGLALYFEAPASFTGEHVLELQGHGGPVLLQTLMQRCLELGARPAQPGEFTQRAFLNDKLDLAQAEAVADLIDAATATAARSAMRSLQGDFSHRIHELEHALIDLRMFVEATLDFPEEDVEFIESARAGQRLDQVLLALERLRSQARRGSLLRAGLTVVLAGAPNAGKSSLLNRLAGTERAIVTEVAGTTRDALRELIQIDGVPLHIVDTAGLRETDDVVERIGIARSLDEIGAAHVVVHLMDARSGLDPAERDIEARLPADVPRIRVMNKIDLSGDAPTIRTEQGIPTIFMSALNGTGLELLRAELLRAAGWESGGVEEDALCARTRHLHAIDRASEHLLDAQLQLSQWRIELFAEDLRLAHRALGEITGEFTADDLLGEIFSRFCIGK